MAGYNQSGPLPLNAVVHYRSRCQHSFLNPFFSISNWLLSGMTVTIEPNTKSVTVFKGGPGRPWYPQNTTKIVKHGGCRRRRWLGDLEPGRFGDVERRAFAMVARR
jgi:hypothetical protein